VYGYGGSYGIFGPITINDGNGTVTTGGGVNDGQVAGVIGGSTFTKSGTGTFVIKGSNTYYGATTISAGTLKLGAASRISSTTALTLNGGAFNTGGFAQTVGSLVLTDNSTILFGTGVHTLTVTAIGPFTSGKTLTINGWLGTFAAPGTTGTNGKLVINSVLTGTVLGQMIFYKSADLTNHAALQLGTKEVVSGN
jgi:autotransporter-associated beta strand protein